MTETQNHRFSGPLKEKELVEIRDLIDIVRASEEGEFRIKRNSPAFRPTDFMTMLRNATEIEISFKRGRKP